MKPYMSEMEKTTILSEVALENVPPDAIFVNGFLFNGFTSEFIIELCQKNR
jgi:hypothetical protein